MYQTKEMTKIRVIVNVSGTFIMPYTAKTIIMWNLPDFTSVETILETACENWGFHILFLLKFHCELILLNSVGNMLK